MLQVLAQTQILTEVLDTQLQNGIRVSLPGENCDKTDSKTDDGEDEVELVIFFFFFFTKFFYFYFFLFLFFYLFIYLFIYFFFEGKFVHELLFLFHEG